MRIAFIGKGGSGKTTLSSAYTLWSAANDKTTVSIDADINIHSWQALGFDEAPKKYLSDSGQQLLKYLEPDRSEFSDLPQGTPFIGCLPPSLSTQFIVIQRDKNFFEAFGQIENNIYLLTTGSYSSDDVGSSCFHVKLFSTQLVAHRILDTSNERVVFDVTAGTDPVATSLCLAYDLHCVVVEPTLKGISVYEDYLQALPVESKVVAIGNKIRTLADEHFLQSHLPQDAYLCSIPFSKHMRALERGNINARLDFQNEINEQISVIDEVVQQQTRDWSKYYTTLQSWFNTYCKKWYDASYGLSLGDLTSESTRELAVRLKQTKKDVTANLSSHP